MEDHARCFLFSYSASKVLDVKVSESGVVLTVEIRGGDSTKRNLTFDEFFNHKVIPGMWLVDAHDGERFFVDENGLSKLGSEVHDYQGIRLKYEAIQIGDKKCSQQKS